MRTLLICHDDAPLDREGLARWLGSFSTFAGAVVIREPAARMRKRIRRELQRVGPLRMLDVLAFRFLHQITSARADRRWIDGQLLRLRRRYPALPLAPELVTSSPNSADVARFIRDARPDIVIARCKTLLMESVFSIPRHGTFVMHPGICPDYRNAHGCFWAMASGDHQNVGMTVLRIDKGVDTGPVFGHFRITADASESHVVVENRAVLENLDLVKHVLQNVAAGRAQRIDTSGRPSATWGQPWLTAHFRMRLASPKLAELACERRRVDG
jgi:folate-dependent phosphoribosylglycinamide formyltransferase PurN